MSGGAYNYSFKHLEELAELVGGRMEQTLCIVARLMELKEWVDSLDTSWQDCEKEVQNRIRDLCELWDFANKEGE